MGQERKDSVAERLLGVGSRSDFFLFFDGDFLGRVLTRYSGLEPKPKREYTRLGLARVTVEWLEDDETVEEASPPVSNRPSYYRKAHRGRSQWGCRTPLKLYADPAEKGRMDANEIGAWRRINSEYAELAAAVFLTAHPGCDGDVDLRRGPRSLVCWCERCMDLRTFELVGEAVEGE